jgi:protein-disulfide isomerase
MRRAPTPEFPVIAFLPSAVVRLAAAAALALALSPAIAAPTPAGTVDMAKVLQPGPLAELSLGDPNGVTMIEYGSLTCSHCATFATAVFPDFQKAYVDTGKVHFIFREFSRNPLDLAAFVLARCEGDDKALATIDLLFAEQDKWAFVDNPLEALITALRPTGMSHDQAMACLKDQSKADALTKVLNAAVQDVKVQGTPTFVVDGKVYDGELSTADLDAILKPLVK